MLPLHQIQHGEDLTIASSHSINQTIDLQYRITIWNGLIYSSIIDIYTLKVPSFFLTNTIVYSL